MPIGIGNAASLPIEPGAYLLLIRLRGPISLPPRFGNQLLAAGRYGYAGSAYGSGGIRARCRRHLSQPSKLRWHIDWLTRMATDVRAIPFPGESECRLINGLSRQDRVAFPVNGFGSTDCQHCKAHLVQFEGHGGWDELAYVLDLWMLDKCPSTAS